MENKCSKFNGGKMDAADIIAKRFDELNDCWNKSDTNSCPKIDRQIWYIVTARCEMDICGFTCIFEQCLTAEEVRYLIATLKDLGEPKLAGYFEEAYQLLIDSNFYDGNEWNGSELNLRDQKRFSEMEEEIRDDNGLWNLDEKLATLVIS